MQKQFRRTVAKPRFAPVLETCLERHGVVGGARPIAARNGLSAAESTSRELVSLLPLSPATASGSGR